VALKLRPMSLGKARPVRPWWPAPDAAEVATAAEPVASGKSFYMPRVGWEALTAEQRLEYLGYIGRSVRPVGRWAVRDEAGLVVEALHRWHSVLQEFPEKAQDGVWASSYYVRACPVSGPYAGCGCRR